MIRKIINIAIAIPLAATLIVASSGATIFLHHCDCQGKTLFSIYHEVGCDMHAQSSTPTHSCCEFEKIQITEPDTESCGCNNEKVSIKLDDVTVVTSVNIPFFKVLLEKFEDINIRINSINNTFILNGYSVSDSPPLPLWGKSLLIRFCSLKTSDIIS